ncbi:hypothetical protein JXJ21_05535, partial [candidate division KSB1 bacterium]|nr:hypothetical protein [candidate division KSB1 bacterium]
MAELLDCKKGGIYVYDENKHVMRIASSFGLSPEFLEKVDYLHFADPRVEMLKKATKPLVIRDEKFTTKTDLLQIEDVESVISISIHLKNKLIEIVNLSMKAKTAQKIDLLNSVRPKTRKIVIARRFLPKQSPNKTAE